MIKYKVKFIAYTQSSYSGEPKRLETPRQSFITTWAATADQAEADFIKEYFGHPDAEVHVISVEEESL